MVAREAVWVLGRDLFFIGEYFRSAEQEPAIEAEGLHGQELRVA